MAIQEYEDKKQTTASNTQPAPLTEAAYRTPSESAATAMNDNAAGSGYSINYNDPRFAQVESDKNAALSNLDSTYNSMIDSTDSFYQAQINAAKDYEAKQTELQNANTDFAIEKIEQQKDQAQKDYNKEQSGAYVDWQKQSGRYGANAEAMAANGLTNTGYSESSQVSMYNTYQNRVAAARESYGLAVQNYNNAITEARLQNNAALAEIAYEALQTQLELSLQGFQYKNQLVLDKANQKTALDNTYYNRYLDVLNQMNTENAMAEQIRQYNESMAEEQRQYNQNYGLQLQQMEEAKRQWEEEMAFEREQWDWKLAQEAAKSSGGSGGSGGSPYQLVDGDDGDDGGNPPKEETKTYYDTKMGVVGTTANNLISKGASTQEVKDYITLQRQPMSLS